jgi:catechol 2,3-dioxygenase-like lactoylglutathione lyase family enzyme
MAAENENQPVLDIKGKEIAQVGIIVRDAARTAKRYSEMFGIGPWSFSDMVATDVILHDRPVVDDESCVRIALGRLGKLQIELLQPLYGPSTWEEFLLEYGEGIHHVSFGIVDNHDQVVTTLMGQGIGIEMQGLLGGAYTFSYMATQKELGTIFEVVKPAPPGIKSTLKPWGRYEPPGPPVININGKEIVQVGIVVEDAENTAKRFWEIFGLGPWTFIDFKRPHISDGVFHGITIRDVDVHVKAAIADLGNIQIELLQPISGPTTHMDFLKTQGQGVHHVSFGEVNDHDEFVFALKKEGIDIESTGLIGGAITFTYLATQKDFGTIFELIKTHPGVENTLVPYGSYPPSKS